MKHLSFPLAALMAAILLLYPIVASAHVKWFVDTENPGVEAFEPYSLTDPVVLIWIVIALTLVGISVFLDGKLPIPNIASSKIRHDFIEILRVFTGMSFLLTAYEGALIAPHLTAGEGIGTALLFLQAAIAIMLISNNFVLHAGLLMFVLQLGLIQQHGITSAVEYFNMLGIALFLIINNLPSAELKERFKPYSVDILRIFTGVALVTLGVTEKLTGAILGQAFVADYQWNFMQLVGFEWFDDRLLVLSAGVMEVVFGTIMILGTVTRLNTLVISGFMLTSNLVFLLQGKNEEALVEFIGHMPIIATALILLLLGYGQRWKITGLRGGSSASPQPA